MILYNTSKEEIVKKANEMLDVCQRKCSARTLSYISESDIEINGYFYADGGGVNNSYKYQAMTTVLGVVTIETKRWGLCARIECYRATARRGAYGNVRTINPFALLSNKKNFNKHTLYNTVLHDRIEKASELREQRRIKYLLKNGFSENQQFSKQYIKRVSDSCIIISDSYLEMRMISDYRFDTTYDKKTRTFESSKMKFNLYDDNQKIYAELKKSLHNEARKYFRKKYLTHSRAEIKIHHIRRFYKSAERFNIKLKEEIDVKNPYGYHRETIVVGSERFKQLINLKMLKDKLKHSKHRFMYVLKNERYHLPGTDNDLRSQFENDFSKVILQDKRTARSFLREAIIAFHKRVKEKRDEEKMQQLKEYVYKNASNIFVSVEDSISAGNCETRTRRFAREIASELHFDSDEVCVRADLLLAKQDNLYIQRAVLRAAERR